MKTPFFSVPSHQTRLREAALSWVGTPFHEHGAVKGPAGGVSCVSLVYALSLEIGIIKDGEIDIPKTPINWHKHNDVSLLGKFFRRSEIKNHIRRKDIEDGLLIGDLIPIEVGFSDHHLAMLISEDEIIHCHRIKGVLTTSLENVKELLTGSVYRIYK